MCRKGQPGSGCGTFGLMKSLPACTKRVYCTREGVIGVQDINLLPAVSVDVARRHPDGVALAVPQGVEGRAAVVDGDVDEPFLLLVVLEHKVRPIVAVKAPVGSCYLLSERHCQQNERQLL